MKFYFRKCHRWATLTLVTKRFKFSLRVPPCCPGELASMLLPCGGTGRCP